ncbi:MAG: RNA-binding protein [Bacillota bacterium]|jgi:RNA-binding protein YlmH
MPLNREKRLSHLTDPELRQAMTRLLDCWEKVYRTGITVVSNFFDPCFLQTGVDILRGLPELSFSTSGGYVGAERARFAIYPHWEKEAFIDYRLAFLDVKGNSKFSHITHRDYQGSLLALGLTRDKIGDILVHSKGCQVVLDEDIADYILLNWQRVAKVPIKVAKIEAEQLEQTFQEKQEMRFTVASPRLDKILSMGFGYSRSKVLPDIKGGKVRVNWKTVIEPSFQIKKGDIISFSGKGRLHITLLTGPSHKGRFFIHVNRLR